MGQRRLRGRRTVNSRPRVRLRSRRGTDFTNKFSRITEAVRGLPSEHALLDGEADGPTYRSPRLT
jgi:ATP-dependent DNA ligase